MMAAFVLLVATFARAQDSQFLFDANGNLLVQTAAITAPPQITGQPQNRVLAPGESASFFVVAANTRALTYEWRFNGVPLGGSATNDAVLLQNVSTNNEGEYRVVLTNPSGSVISAPAMLWIDSDADGVGDTFELTYFGNLTNSATGDFDGDGSPNLQEFLDGTNPTNSASVVFHLTVLPDGGSVVRTPDLSSYTNGQTVTLTATASSNETFHAWLGAVVTRSNPVALVMTNNKTIYARFTPITFLWTNTASGDWNTATNWSPNLVPGSNDSVVIDRGVNVTLNTDADCADVWLGQFAQPNLSGSGNLTVRGNFFWGGGVMGGSGRTIIETGATLNIANSGSASLSSRTLENRGTVLWTGSGGLTLNNSTVTNRAGALFHAQNSAALNFGGGTARFDNLGTFRKSTSTGTTVVSGVSFNNVGVVEIQTGTVNLASGGTNAGSFDVALGAALDLSGGTFSAGVGSSITGAGRFTASGATVTLAGLVNVTGNNTFSNGNVNVIGNFICTNNTLTVAGAVTATFSGTGPVNPAVLNVFNGTLTGTSNVTVGTVMNWTGGTMSGSGRTIIAPGATLNLANPGLVSLGRTLENGGTVLWTGAGNINCIASVVTNRTGALFHAQSAGSFSLGAFAACRIDNAGTFRKSANTGTTTIAGSISFINYGVVDIRSGILAANGGYASANNALLNCALGGTTPGIHFGQLQVAGTVTLNGALRVDFANGFSPALNDSFSVLTAGTRNGAFANFSYPSNTVTMQLSNTANSVILRVAGLVVPPPTLLPPELLGADIKVTWTSVSNITYRLEFNPDLANLTNWNLIPGDVTAVSNTASKLDPLTPSNRLYRVRILP
jgi:hypothetical protein